MHPTRFVTALAVAALALTAFATTASATTLSVAGTNQTWSVSMIMSLKSGTSALLSDTSGFFANTCTTSVMEGSDFYKTTGTSVEGPLDRLSWGTTATPCKEGNPTLDTTGSLLIERIGTTTNGTVKVKTIKVTVPSALGTLYCTTSEFGTDIGTLTGVASGFATLDVNAVLNCTVDVKWTGTYIVTLPGALGVEG